jgi:hypothetical protein
MRKAKPIMSFPSREPFLSRLVQLQIDERFASYAAHYILQPICSQRGPCFGGASRTVYDIGEPFAEEVVVNVLWKIMVVVLLAAIAIGVVVERAVTSTQIKKVADIRSARDVEGGTVALKGVIVYAEENKFVLDDGTGRAELSTCPVWYKRLNLYEGDEIMAVGQVMSNPSLSMKCDFMLSVYKIYKGREMIQVRRGPGKPPWASYRSLGTPAETFWP